MKSQSIWHGCNSVEKFIGQFILTVVIFLFVFLCFLTTSHAQTKCRQDPAGNYVALTVSSKSQKVDEVTGKTFTDSKGNTHLVMKTSTGRLVYYRVSAKTEKKYKVYLDAK